MAMKRQVIQFLLSSTNDLLPNATTKNYENILIPTCACRVQVIGYLALFTICMSTIASDVHMVT